MMSARRRAFTLIELLVVVGLLALLIAILLPSLSKAREKSLRNKLQSDSAPASAFMEAARGDSPNLPLARITDFDASIDLTPRLSVGTANPESIYETRFSARLQAAAPAGNDGKVEIRFPLPPQIISLADLSVSVNNEPSDAVRHADGKLIWSGRLSPDPTPVQLTYSALGKGLYSFDVPPGGIVNSFHVNLGANSDIRMLELSLQPTQVTRSAGKTNYTWDYKKLLFGRPIALDVLGIAPIDRLGELSRLGPISVVLFGLIVGLVARAFGTERFDRWMLLLVIGTFTGAYPLMYFAQEFFHPTVAMAASGAVVILIIAVRTSTIMGIAQALLGVVLPAIVIMVATLAAALDPRLQGILLTALALAFFIIAMALAPRLARLTPPSPPSTLSPSIRPAPVPVSPQPPTTPPPAP